jgi:GcvH upstream region-like protein
MFTFFRRYQRAIYFVITVVIILSFSFFGTYSAFVSGKGDDPVVFRTVDGTKITRSQFSDYVHFLSTDSLSLGEHGAALGNPLNDGVFAHDIIASGVGEVLAARFAKELEGEWIKRWQKEQRFQPYRHPQAPFVSAVQVWSYFAPEMKDRLEQYQKLDNPTITEIYSKKAPLFLAERQFPSAYLRQILLYQQKQFDWLEPDVLLENRQLGLFGYQQASDWFGSAFFEKTCEFIVQTASYAQEQGWSVSTDEALASLYLNAQNALQRLPQGENMTAEELFQKTLRELNMDRARAVSVWKDVLLCRKALIEIPLQVVLNRQPFDACFQHASMCSDVDTYQLQPPLRLKSIQDLLKVECWIQAVQAGNDTKSLIPSDQFRSPEEVLQSFPELVDTHFVISFSSVTTDQLMKNVRLRDVWNWQQEDEHWDLLCKEIPQLKVRESTTPEARFQLLEKLPPQLRLQADRIAKEKIIEEHHQWIDEALRQATPETIAIGLRSQGGGSPFEGVNDRASFISLLKRAPAGEVVPELQAYTQDKKHYYRIQILDRGVHENIVPLPDVLADGTMEKIVDRILENAYGRLRSERPQDFKQENGQWKPFKDVKEKVGELYFASFFRQLDRAIQEWKVKLPRYCSWDDAKTARVAVRFLPLLEKLYIDLQKEDVTCTCIVNPLTVTDPKTLVIEDRPLSDTWRLVRTSTRVVRKDVGASPALADAMTLDVGRWLAPRYSQELGPFVGRVTKKSVVPYEDSVRSVVFDYQEAIGKGAVQSRTQELLNLFYPKPAS